LLLTVYPLEIVVLHVAIRNEIKNLEKMINKKKNEQERIEKKKKRI